MDNNITVKIWFEDWKKRSLNNWSEYWLYLGTFLDIFYKNPSNKYFIDEPNFDDVEDYIATFTVCSICYLCDRYNLEKPEWARSEKFILKKPWFSGNTEGPLRCFYLIESPQAFKCRNMFVSKKVLSRC